MTKGIDISLWQGTDIDWNQVINAGYEFVYIKCAQGLSTTDSAAQTNAINAKNAGLKIGYYFFADPTQNSVLQADFLNNTLNNLPEFDLIPVLDLETNTEGMNMEQITAWANSFYNEMQKNGKEIMLYTFTSFYNSFIVGHELLISKLWIAEYTSGNLVLPIGRTDYHLWQFTQKQTVPGFKSPVDCDSCPDLSQIMFSPSV